MIVAKGFEAETLEELKTRIINFYSEKYKHMPTINYILQINEDGSEDIFSDDIVESLTKRSSNRFRITLSYMLHQKMWR